MFAPRLIHGRLWGLGDLLVVFFISVFKSSCWKLTVLEAFDLEIIPHFLCVAVLWITGYMCIFSNCRTK